MARAEAVQAHPPPAARSSNPARSLTRFAVDYAVQHPNRAITVLQAGCTTAGPELDLAQVRASARDLVLCLVDDDSPATRAAIARRPDLRSATLGELRSVPIGPRAFDIVQCSLVLHRVSNAEVVLGRLVAALRPGGLLLLRTLDRETAAGFLDRSTPRFLRELTWRAGRPGQPGPFPARYEPIASARGIEAFVTRHGLVVADRQACSTGGGHARATIPYLHKVVAWLSRGRLAIGHDELRYVIRKPEDRFARLLP